MRKFYAHCVVCGRKNYRLQVFSCQRYSLALSAASALQAHDPGVRSPDEFTLVPSAQSARSLRKRQGVAQTGGEYRARTGDLLVANQALSQLS